MCAWAWDFIFYWQNVSGAGCAGLSEVENLAKLFDLSLKFTRGVKRSWVEPLLCRQGGLLCLSFFVLSQQNVSLTVSLTFCFISAAPKPNEKNNNMTFDGVFHGCNFLSSPSLLYSLFSHVKGNSADSYCHDPFCTLITSLCFYSSVVTPLL